MNTVTDNLGEKSAELEATRQQLLSLLLFESISIKERIPGLLWTTEAQKDHRQRRSDSLEFPIRSRLPPRAEAAAERSASGWDTTQVSARLGGFHIAAGGQKNITGCRRWHKSSVRGSNDRHTCSWIPAQAAVDLSALLFNVVPFFFFFFLNFVQWIQAFWESADTESSPRPVRTQGRLAA